MRHKIIPYDPKLKQLARNLRNNSTLSEILLWNYLKGKQMRGYDFHRQKPIGNSIVDFYCKELCLAIEIDGESHHNKLNEDIKRQKILESTGIYFLRFDDLDVKQNMEGVLLAIDKWIEQYEKKSKTKNPPRHPESVRDATPPRRGLINRGIQFEIVD